MSIVVLPVNLEWIIADFLLLLMLILHPALTTNLLENLFQTFSITNIHVSILL